MTLLEFLNFYLFQWFFFRLCKWKSETEWYDIYINPPLQRYKKGWGLIFVLPLTGWWSDYIWIKKGTLKLTEKTIIF